MAKEIPYFKFFTGEWLTGDITLCSIKTQGVFIGICCYYWNKQGHYLLANAKQRFNEYAENVNELIEKNIIKVKDDILQIDFLDAQLKERSMLHTLRVKAGRKGGSVKRIQASAKQRPSNAKPIRKEKIRKDKIRKEEKSVYVFDNPPSEQDVYLYMLGFSNEKKIGLKPEAIKVIATQWHNHYSSEDCNWTYMAGGTKKTKMKDWKAKCRDWILREKKK